MWTSKLLVVVYVLFFLQGTTSTQEIEYYRIINKASGKVLDVENGSGDLRAKIVQFTRQDRSETQQWQIVPFGNFCQVANRKSSYVLDVPNRSIIAGAPLVLYTSNPNRKDNQNQLWKLNKTKDGYFSLVVLHSNMVLTLEENSKEDNIKVIQAKFVGNDTQLWQLESTKSKKASNSKQPPKKKQ
ncbi:MAG: RICIN domain-containing protein [Planctomycetia bacterium]|nr:RICIN domain-containing protein [Planctomycetia bacterium]